MRPIGPLSSDRALLWGLWVVIVRFGGHLDWLSRLFVHLLFLVGLRNRRQVLFHWPWSNLTFGRGARLIYGSFKPRKQPVLEASDASGLA
jgi:NADH:ubiquinone reductase (H+-translocating)